VRLPSPLHRGVLLRRYKRFLADVELENGTLAVAHVADPGRLPGLAVPGAEVWLSSHHDPRRKLPYRIELIRQGSALVGVNSANPNRIARRAFEAGRIPFARGYRIRAREPRIGPGTRLDFLLENHAGRRLFVEVKAISWRRDGHLAAFPDAPTLRGRRHLETLRELARAGEQTALLFIAQRSDVETFAPAEDIDPDYARALVGAREAGVRVSVWRCAVNYNAICLDKEIPMV